MHAGGKDSKALVRFWLRMIFMDKGFEGSPVTSQSFQSRMVMVTSSYVRKFGGLLLFSPRWLVSLRRPGTSITQISDDFLSFSEVEPFVVRWLAGIEDIRPSL